MKQKTCPICGGPLRTFKMMYLRNMYWYAECERHPSHWRFPDNHGFETEQGLLEFIGKLPMQTSESKLKRLLNAVKSEREARELADDPGGENELVLWRRAEDELKMAIKDAEGE
jgi:hypothetical protein